MRPDFVQRVPFAHLQHYPRYLKAIRLRLERLELDPAKDNRKAAQFAPLWQKYQDAPDSILPEDLEAYRWMLEELRVMLFAQELKTAYPVSVEKAGKFWRGAGGGLRQSK